MFLQGPLVLIAETPSAGLTQALGRAGAFPIVEVRWVDAASAIASIQPAGVVIAELGTPDARIAEGVSRQIKQVQPTLPVIARVRSEDSLSYPGALAITANQPPERLIARLAAAQRVRSLHATILRRLESFADEGQNVPALSTSDPLEDATVLVFGRGRSYPTLSVAVGERVRVVGALSVEAASKCLATREIDAIAIGEGFSPRIIQAFLMVLAEDARFRDLAVCVMGDGASPEEMPNILREHDPIRMVERLLPFARLHAFDERLRRMLKSLELKGMIDPETGLLNGSAFAQDLMRAIEEANERGDGLSIARFSFDDSVGLRTSMEAARVVSRLMRAMDFACRQDDGSIVTVFTGTHLRAAHVVARRLASVLKQTLMSAVGGRQQVVPNVTLATLKSSDSVLTLMARIAPRTVAAE